MIFAGFLGSRAILSLGTFLLGLNAIRDIHPRQWLKNKWWLLGVAWVAIYAVSWFWTEDKANWNERFEVKLPILLLPLGFSFMPAFTIKQLRFFTVTVSLILLCAVIYSLYYFIQAPADYINGYSVSHVLPSLPKNDHIRISMCIGLFIIWCFYFWAYLRTRVLKVFTVVVMAILIMYLHILAARTGLLIFYSFIVIYAIYIAISKSKWIGIGMLVLLGLLLVTAYNTSPTLQNRIHYFKYTYELYKNGQLEGHYSDMGRIISYDIALNKIGKNPIKGVGAGDMLKEMKTGYDQWYPAVSDEGRLVPHNQFMVVALGCGIPALVIFLLWVFFPITQLRKTRGGFFFLSTWLVLLIPLMVEPTLEVQFGVFVYLFFLLWQHHAMLHEPVEA